jgi:hypothetical protein
MWYRLHTVHNNIHGIDYILYISSSRNKLNEFYVDVYERRKCYGILNI